MPKKKRTRKGPMPGPMVEPMKYKPSVHLEGKGKAPKVHVGDKHSLSITGKVKSVRQNSDGTHSMEIEDHKIHHGIRTVKKVDNT